MADYENIVLERLGREERIARITLNRPEKLNTLTPQLLAELDECLHDLEADHECRVIVLRGAGRAFSAGYDLTGGGRGGGDRKVRRYKSFDDKKRYLAMGLRANLQHIADLQLYYWNMAKITIAQLHGYALAGGCEFAMMSDLVVAADDCQIGHPGVRGLGTARNGNIWPLVIGMRKAKELYYTGDSVSGSEAAQMGMINYAWPANELEENTLQFAERIANMTSDHLALLKLTMNRFYENMGIYPSIRSATDQDAMGQLTEYAYAFSDQMRKGDLKQALEWRDGPYRTGDDYKRR